MIEIYTDGSCLFNPGGRGAWAFIVYENGQKKTTQSGVEEITTSNRMELTAIYKALEWIKFYHPRSEIKIYSDSIYAVNCFSGKWRRKSNRDIWDKVEKLMPSETLFSKTYFNVHFYWVKGHADSIGNNEADRVANAAIGMLDGHICPYSFYGRAKPFYRGKFRGNTYRKNWY